MMKKYILFGIGLLFLLSGSAASAQEPLLTTEYSHRRYTSQDGLPSMIMQRIYKDSKGFLWQGTLKGASCFDGLNFKPYIFANMMNIDRIEEINGEIRFMWNSDLLYPETQKSVHLTDTLSFNPHNSYSLPPNYYIFDNNEGKKYFVTVKDDTISEVICIPQLQGLYMCKTYLDLQQNTLYIPNNRDKKVFIYNFQNKHVQIMENIVMESFIQHSRLGLLGIGRDGIYRIDGDKATLYVPLKFEMQNKIAKETKNGDIYIMDFYNVYRISNKKVEHLYHNSELTLWDMTLDNDGNLWLATNKGLYNFFHFDFNNYQIPNHKIRSVAQDSDGIYWFAGDNEDIFSMSDGVLKPVNYPLNHALQTVSFNSVFSFNNITYFLIRGGILIHENRRFYWADLPSGNQYYSNMAEYGKNLLVTGSDMIFEITPQGKIVKTLSAEALKQSGYLGLAVDKNNRIIAGGDDGISIVENDKVTFLKSDFTCFSDIVCVNSQNHIFSTSHKHLNLVKDDTVITIRSFDNDYIMALLPVDADNLIISTLKGFYIFSTKAYFERDAIEMLFYNRDNGMDAIEPAFSETVLDKEGKVWMITTEKVVNFDPEKLLRQTSVPSLTVRNCAVSKDNVNWENIADFANSSFAYYNDNIRFSFIGLNYSAAENVRYRYRLRGFQDEFSEPARSREVTFNNLPPGDYVFEIYADSGTDESRSEIQSVSFSIKPAFWQTAWFYSLCLVVFILITGFILYIYMYQKTKKKIQSLERQKQINNLQIQSIRLRSIPHFNANVLAGIEYYIMNRSKKETNHYLNMYSSFTNRTLRDVDQPARTLEQEIDYVKLYLGLEKMRFGKKLEFVIDIAPDIDMKILLPNMILHTHCENALKHGLRAKKGTGHLRITATPLANDRIMITVEDDGIGRRAAKRLNTGDTGQGLRILSQQIELYNQSNNAHITQRFIDLDTGTRVEITVPEKFKYN